MIGRNFPDAETIELAELDIQTEAPYQKIVGLYMVPAAKTLLQLSVLGFLEFQTRSAIQKQ